mgnify:CR=1 FL=1
MKIYNLAIPEERKDKSTGEVKTYWHRCGSAFEQKGGGYALVIPEGMTISGRVLMFERDKPEPASASEAFKDGELNL